jgi:hypothetical protein
VHVEVRNKCDAILRAFLMVGVDFCGIVGILFIHYGCSIW